MNYLKKVFEFQETFLMAIGPDINHVESLETRQLRIKLLFEELHELAEASDVRHTFQKLCHETLSNDAKDWADGDNVDRVEELDALCDLQYVLTGKIVSSGLWPVFDEAFKRVHKNNMEKAHVSIRHMEDTAIHKNLMISKCKMIKISDDVYLLHNESGKLVKPHDHKKVDLSDLLEN
jgi:predicted HAD superfamily Cof-like phosphohydrolase